MLRLSWISVLFSALLCVFMQGCSNHDEPYDRDVALRRALEVQRLQNLQPGDPQAATRIEAIIDSMGRAGKDACYFGAVNVLIDRLFSDGRYAEADSLAVRMQHDAETEADSLAMAMAKRVRAQILYKLSQPDRARKELLDALPYASDPLKSGTHFGTAASINEWLHIAAKADADTAAMEQAGYLYAEISEKALTVHPDADSTAHYRVTALAFKADNAMLGKSTDLASALLDSATNLIRKNLPARAYEHFYDSRCRLRTATGDYSGALADIDTLLATHRCFPWFYLRDLQLKAQVENEAGMHKEASKTYSDYIAFHDSLSADLTDRRLHDLTLLYRSELDKEERRVSSIKLYGLGAVSLLLLILFGVTLRYVIRERKRNRLLVERLHEYDRAGQAIMDKITDASPEEKEESPISRLDRHMLTERPYTNPALGRKELAELLGIPQDVLAQLIRSEYDQTVHAYINSYRTEEARRILDSDSGETIAEIAVRLGFGTSRTLQRAFKDRFGMSPTQYKEAALSLRNTDNQSIE